MKWLLCASLLATSALSAQQPKAEPYVRLNVTVPSRYVMLIGPNGTGTTVQPSISIGANNVLKKNDDLSVSVWQNYDVPKRHFNEQDFDLTYKLPEKKTRMGSLIAEMGGGHFNYARVDFGNHDHYSRGKITLDSKIMASFEHFHLFPNGSNGHGDLFRVDVAKQFQLTKNLYLRPMSRFTFSHDVYGNSGFLTTILSSSVGWSNSAVSIGYQVNQLLDRRQNTENLLYHGPLMSWTF